MPLPQYTVNFGIEEAYAKAKAALIEKGCSVVSEEQPIQLLVRQGSLWGISPKTAKKTVRVTLEASGDKTNLTYSSKLAADWKNVTIIGCFLSLVLAAVCVWMALDLSQFMFDGNPSFWSWLITSNDKAQFSTGEAFVNLAYGLAVFLSIIIAIEAVIYVYAGRHIEVFAETTLVQLA
jgi:hypothetical protein